MDPEPVGFPRSRAYRSRRLAVASSAVGALLGVNGSPSRAHCLRRGVSTCHSSGLCLKRWERDCSGARGERLRERVRERGTLQQRTDGIAAIQRRGTMPLTGLRHPSTIMFSTMSSPARSYVVVVMPETALPGRRLARGRKPITDEAMEVVGSSSLMMDTGRRGARILGRRALRRSGGLHRSVALRAHWTESRALRRQSGPIGWQRQFSGPAEPDTTTNVSMPRLVASYTTPSPTIVIIVWTSDRIPVTASSPVHHDDIGQASCLDRRSSGTSMA